MLSPSKTKYRKPHKPSLKGLSKRGCLVEFGEYGLKALGRAYITDRQIEAARIAMTRHIKRCGKVYIRIFPDMSMTAKPLVRMGKGKGNVVGWFAVVCPGRVLFEIGHVEEALAREALRLASAKLPVKTRFVERVCVLGRK